MTSVNFSLLKTSLLSVNIAVDRDAVYYDDSCLGDVRNPAPSFLTFFSCNLHTLSMSLGVLLPPMTAYVHFCFIPPIFITDQGECLQLAEKQRCRNRLRARSNHRQCDINFIPLVYKVGDNVRYNDPPSTSTHPFQQICLTSVELSFLVSIISASKCLIRFSGIQFDSVRITFYFSADKRFS